MKKLKICLVVGLWLMQTVLCSEQTPFQRLMEGNRRFAEEKSLYPDRLAERRKETAVLQEPFAAILGCSDSRVAPEILFDQGIGDLFIVRVAGNIVGPIELDSLEYSCVHLHSTFIMVLGHENCGAVKAVLDGTTKDIEAVAELIQPAVDKVKNLSTNRLEEAIRMNVKLVVEQLKRKPVLRNLIEKKKLTIAGGYYDFHTGNVEIVVKE